MRAISEDLTGSRFGRWVALRPARLNGRRGWLCACDCGTERVVLTSNLYPGKSTSCGCQRKEMLAEIGRRNRASGWVSYEGAHQRVRRSNGPAALYSCIDCGNAAKEWSYDHSDPDERYAPNPRNGRPMAYSIDAACYVPRCKGCHVSFDQRCARGKAKH